jgi:hypothetical protein
MEGIFFCILLHTLYDSGFSFITPNSKTLLADSKILLCVLLLKNVRHFLKKCLQALLAHLHLFEGLHEWLENMFGQSLSQDKQ